MIKKSRHYLPAFRFHKYKDSNQAQMISHSLFCDASSTLFVLFLFLQFGSLTHQFFIFKQHQNCKDAHQHNRQPKRMSGRITGFRHGNHMKYCCSRINVSFIRTYDLAVILESITGFVNNGSDIRRSVCSVYFYPTLAVFSVNMPLIL